MHTAVLCAVALPLLLVLRIILLLPGRRPDGVGGKGKRKSNDTCSLGVFLGSGMPSAHRQRTGHHVGSRADRSGGHTAEMCTLLSSTSFSRYTPRTYIYCPGDDHSLRLVRDLEGRRAAESPSGSKVCLETLPLVPS